MVRTKDSGTQVNSDGSKCLMQAPFKCQTTNLNDYPIQEHKDFYKYVEASKVQPSKDVDMTQYIAKNDIIALSKTAGEFDIRSHPEIKNYILRSEIPKFTDSEEYKKMLGQLQDEQKKTMTLQEQMSGIQQKVQSGSVQTRDQLNQHLDQIVKTIEKSNTNEVSPVKSDEDNIETAINKLAVQGLITEKQRMEYLNQIKNMKNKCSETNRANIISGKADEWIKLSVAKNVCYKCDLTSLNDKVYKDLPEGIKGSGWVPKSDVYQVCKSCNLVNM
jgi:2-succinyl-5-enolpyruvyl-6-hydroxy-3-cyclohexene-1-carboxylate synthase